MASHRRICEPLFTATGCNRESSCLSWDPSGRWAAYGSHHSVALWSAERGAVVSSFSGGSTPVTKVRWLSSSVLVASSNAGLLLVHLGVASFSAAPPSTVSFYSVSLSSSQRFHGLCAIPNARGPGESLIVMSGSHLVWFTYSASSRSCELVDSPLLLPPRQLSECVAGALLPHAKVSVVAVGGADRKIHLYVDDNHTGFAPITWLEGHQDWVRDLDFFSDSAASGDLMLASCSSDNFIRLWRISRFLDQGALQEEQHSDIQAAENRQKVAFAVNDGKGNVPRFSGALDALLTGHSHWVQSVRWNRDGSQLISASMDKTMILWEKDPEDNVWVDQTRLGEIGGNALGFYGADFSPDSLSVLAHSYNGSLHLWKRATRGAVFEPIPVPSGHMGAVSDVCWEASGRYFISSSLDETVRLWAPWRERGNDAFFELARPQIHGHDINAATLLGSDGLTLISGADEKTLRVFEATESFCQSLLNVSGVPLPQDGKKRAFGATMPPLGLSNKPLNGEHDVEAADAAREQEAFPEEVWRADPVVLQKPPVETLLSQSTLWVEQQKLYGHASELHAVCASPDGMLVASACKGKAKPHTDVLIWSTQDWRIACRLSRHKMTVTRIAFSHNGRWIATVSRDLRLCLWKRDDKPDAISFSLAWEKENAHSRIIWDCCWAPDDSLLLTCSRDKKLTVWRLDEAAGELEQATQLKRSVPLTSVAFFPTPMADGAWVVAVGNSEGGLSLWNAGASKWSLLTSELVHYHGMHRVVRLSFKYVAEIGSVVLLSCGEDWAVRLLRVGFTDAFSQLCALMLSLQKTLDLRLPQLVVAKIWEHLK